MQIGQFVTSHCTMTFEKALFKSGQTIEHK